MIAFNLELGKINPIRTEVETRKSYSLDKIPGVGVPESYRERIDSVLSITRFDSDNPGDVRIDLELSAGRIRMQDAGEYFVSRQFFKQDIKIKGFFRHFSGILWKILLTNTRNKIFTPDAGR